MYRNRKVLKSFNEGLNSRRTFSEFAKRNQAMLIIEHNGEFTAVKFPQ